MSLNNTTNSNRFSFLGNIQMNGADICIATILNRRHVLTEAVCCRNIVKHSQSYQNNQFELVAQGKGAFNRAF